MTEDDLRARIRELELELGKKEDDIEQFEDTIEELEETIMKLEDFTPEEGTTKKSKKMQAAESKFAYYLEEKDKEIRELKDRMGFLRKEKIQIQQELEKLKPRKTESSVIRVEDIRSKSPLNALVKDLQEKVNKQRSLIHKLRLDVARNDKFNEKLKIKNEEIEYLKSEILSVNQKIKDLSTASEDKSGASITTKLIEDLQNQLNKSKRQITSLKQKLSKSNKKSKNESHISDVELLRKELNELKDLQEVKNKETELLKNKVETLQKAEISANFEPEAPPSDDMVKTLREELQNKLNKSKLQIRTLQEQLKRHQASATKEDGKTLKELEGNLKMQREMAIFLQKQLETKEGEIETIKKEAVQIKKRYRQLENQLKQKDQKLNELQVQFDKKLASTIQIQSEKQKMDPNLALRIKELMSMNEDFKKDIIEQRIEISQLRKKV